MTRFEQKTTPLIYSVIAAGMVSVFVADIFTPLGIAVWIIYLVPIFLTVLFWRPAVPLVMGLITTGLMIAGYVLSPPGVEPRFAQLNRGFGIFTVWVLAVFSFQFIRNKIAARKQEWLQSGQTQLSARMGGDQPLEQLGDNILRFIAEHVGAQVGAMFVQAETGFKRLAAYAALPQAGVPAQFALGEGLLGQAAKDGRTLVISEVPAGYLTIGSALGKSEPGQLLISPVSLEGEVNAVLEFGFIRAINRLDQELLERVTESIAVAVRSAQYRARLRELLDETRRQAEELQAQTEELRVTNEELNEQSRALRDSQTRLELQQTELEQTNSQLEEQTQMLEMQRDELARAKGTLEEQARELKQASQYKSDFLANMSHELRTPLNSSLILAKLLADNRGGNLTPEQVKYAETIQSAGHDLLTLINDILDLSKIEAGHMDIKIQDVRVTTLLENLGRTFQPLAGQKSLEFRIGVVPGTPERLETDSQRLEQVLRNLLSNAIKFTDKGTVTLEVSRTGEGCVAFSVQDTGMGIPEEQQQIVFEPFRQADGTTNRKHGGTGLGLSIARELVRLMGGGIHLTSQVGRGSTFTLTLPEVFAAPLHPRPEPLPRPGVRSLPPPPLPMIPARVPPPVAPARTVTRRPDDDRERLSGNSRVILVIEDDESFARILCDLAHELRFECLIATTAEEGLALAAQFQPSAVVLDVRLPDNSGLSVLDRLKADARTRHIPVHVVSGSDCIQTALSLGAIGYMLKPVKREQLIKAFEELEDRFTEKLRRILVVDDDPVQMDHLRQLLASRDVQVVAALTARACLEQLQTLTFDCMVLDLTLPDASGFGLLETLSREDCYSFPPVIVYTSRELTPAEEQQLRRYSKSIIIKGAKSPERLLDEVTLFLHKVVADLPPEQQRMIEKARSRDAALEGKRILVVEDDVRNVFALTSILEPRGAQVQIARNGREALEALDQVGHQPSAPIDLILMDIMMPEMDGLTAMREIRKRAEWKKLPIIALTAKAMKNDQEECLQAGANDYLAKPLDVEKLLSLVRVWVSR